jgi:hypothetical protein
MKNQHPITHEQQVQEEFITEALHHMNTAADHVVVGRTQRLVRERVTDSQSQRRMLRSLWLPLMVCSSMVIMIAYSAWTVLEQWNTMMADGAEFNSANNTPMLILTLWFLPLTMGVMVMIWFRSRKR